MKGGLATGKQPAHSDPEVILKDGVELKLKPETAEARATRPPRGYGSDN